jgi:hypothetical protein
MMIKKLLKMPQNKCCINCDNVVSILPLFIFLGFSKIRKPMDKNALFNVFLSLFMKIFLSKKSFCIYNGFVNVSWMFSFLSISTCNNFDCEMGRFFFIDKGIHRQYWRYFCSLGVPNIVHEV